MSRMLRGKLISVLFILGLVLLTAMSVITYRQILVLQKVNSMVTHTYQVIEKSNLIILTLFKADQQIYTITESASQANIRNLIATTAANVRQLRYLTIDNALQQSRLNELEPIITEKIDSLENLLTDKSVADLTRTHNLTQKIERSIDVFKQREYELLDQRSSRSFYEAKMINFVICSVVFLAYLLLITTFVLIIAQNKQLILSEKRQRELESQYTDIINSSKDPIAALNTNLEFVAFNKAYETMFADFYGKKIIIGNNLLQMLQHSTNTDNLISAWKRALRGTEFVMTTSFKQDSRFEVFYEMTFSAIRRNGHTVAAAQIMRNITEKIKIDKLKTEFVSTVSHELRTPLTSIRGSLSLALSDTFGKLNEKFRQLLNIASQNCDRLIFLINDLLDFDKLEKSKMYFDFQSVNINRLVEEAVGGNKDYGKNFSVEIILEKYPEPLMVEVDPDRIRQVLDNFISNAIKFSPAQSEIKVVISLHDEKVRVSVVDKGFGVPQEFKDLIFQKFVQVDSSTTRKHGGTGLGLSISKAIIEQHHGQIGFQSEPNLQTSFYFDLPLVSSNSRSLI